VTNPKKSVPPTPHDGWSSSGQRSSRRRGATRPRNDSGRHQLPRNPSLTPLSPAVPGPKATRRRHQPKAAQQTPTRPPSARPSRRQPGRNPETSNGRPGMIKPAQGAAPPKTPPPPPPPPPLPYPLSAQPWCLRYRRSAPTGEHDASTDRRPPRRPCSRPAEHPTTRRGRHAGRRCRSAR
jgi:hypothetical protein